MSEKENLKTKFKQTKMDAMPFIGKSICDYCTEKDIENVIFLDRSARPAYIPFKEQWKQNYSDKKRPNIYFLSPKRMEQFGTDEDEINLFKKEHPHLTKNLKPTLVFDVCVKEGLTTYNTKDLLQKTGFEKTYFMVTAIHSDKKQYVLPDVVLFENHSLGCHLFGSFLEKEIGVQRNEQSFLAKKEESTYNHIVKKNREELRLASK